MKLLKYAGFVPYLAIALLMPVWIWHIKLPFKMYY